MSDLPYAGTSGHAGSQTSAERAQRADSSGLTGRRQRRIEALLERRGPEGLTWKEAAEITGWHHGQASGVLSGLHKVGRVTRLTDMRDRCKVYVLPGHVAGRFTEPPGETSTTALMRQMAEQLAVKAGPCIHLGHLPDGDCWECRTRSLLDRFENRR